MLVHFSVENYRSYWRKQELSLVAGNSRELPNNAIDCAGVAALGGMRLLKGVGIYGANASGKSNLLRAMRNATEIIGKSAVADPKTRLPYRPFGLAKSASSEPTKYTFLFVLGGVLHEYMFAFNAETILEERLASYPRKVERELFRRTISLGGSQEWTFSQRHFKRDRALEKRALERALFLSVGAQWNHPQLREVHDWFVSHLDFHVPELAEKEQFLTIQKCIDDESFRTWVLQVLKNADTGICGIEARRADIRNKIPKDILSQLPKDAHEQFSAYPQISIKRRNDHGGSVTWNLDQESSGTRRLLSFLGTWHAAMQEQRTVVIDEFNDSMHPIMCRELLKRFMATEPNHHGSQLIFATHDTTLLDPTLLRRDQIYFAEKSGSGATELYSLLKYTPRKDEALQRGYLAGRYGAIPFLGDFTFEEPRQASANC